MKGYNRCAMCDEWYNPNSPDAKVHDHPEPQSGLYRDAWLDSEMRYEEWTKKTRVGQEWLEYKRGTPLIKISLIKSPAFSEDVKILCSNKVCSNFDPKFEHNCSKVIRNCKKYIPSRFKLTRSTTLDRKE